jgi:hypothetical protein
MLELLPLPVTALIPVAVFPMLGIMSTNETAMCYMKDTCMLYLGGKYTKGYLCDIGFPSITYMCYECNGDVSIKTN